MLRTPAIFLQVSLTCQAAAGVNIGRNTFAKLKAPGPLQMDYRRLGFLRGYNRVATISSVCLSPSGPRLRTCFCWSSRFLRWSCGRCGDNGLGRSFRGIRRGRPIDWHQNSFNWIPNDRAIGALHFGRWLGGGFSSRRLLLSRFGFSVGLNLNRLLLGRLFLSSVLIFFVQVRRLRIILCW